eukprot:7154820-Ditylum_brightwellii.AAC.1
MIRLLKDLFYEAEDGRRQKIWNDILMLLQKEPDAVKEENSIGSKPLHIACSYRPPFEVVTDLLQAWPDSVKEKNMFGDTPLHRACMNRAPVEIVAALLQIWPGGVKEKIDVAIHHFIEHAIIEHNSK